MRLLIAASIAIVVAVTPPPADAVLVSGCSVTAAGHPSIPSSCHFVAIGPVDFVASTTSGWRIRRSADGGKTWLEVASSAGNELRPTHVNTTVGELRQVKPFDLVELSIVRAHADIPLSDDDLGYQHGSISATSDLPRRR